MPGRLSMIGSSRHVPHGFHASRKLQFFGLDARTGRTDQHEPQHRPDRRHNGQRDDKTRREWTDQVVGHDPGERKTAHSKHDGCATRSNKCPDTLAHDFTLPPGHVRQLIGKPASERPIRCHRVIGIGEQLMIAQRPNRLRSIYRSGPVIRKRHATQPRDAPCYQHDADQDEDTRRDEHEQRSHGGARAAAVRPEEPLGLRYQVVVLPECLRPGGDEPGPCQDPRQAKYPQRIRDREHHSLTRIQRLATQAQHATRNVSPANCPNPWPTVGWKRRISS